MKVPSNKIGFVVLLMQLIVSLHVTCATDMNEDSAISPVKRARSEEELQEDAVVKALERGIFARRDVISQPPGVWGRSSERSFRARAFNRDRRLFRPQSPAERRALQDSIEHLLQAKEALDVLNKRASQPPGVWGKRAAAQPPGVWGKRTVRTQPPGVWGKRTVRTQPPGVWGKRALEFMEREYALGQVESKDEDTIAVRSASVSQPPGVWGRRSIERSHSQEQ
uniref:Prepropeptide n=1 Tax=Tripedalia cystophora TaxID=6141 RepID=A0A482A040_TRICY|nr:prepropeptide [Tripedalia cystophora]